MLGSADLIAFVPTRHPARARAFYEDTLGLRFVSQDDFAVEFNANRVTLRIVDVSRVEGHRPYPFTVLGWLVADVASTVAELESRGVTFERFPGLSQDRLGIWDSPSGARVAWFKDPDGNVLSVTQVER